VLGHLALDKEYGLLRVKAHGQKPCVGLLGVLSELGRHLTDCQGVQVRQCVHALIALVLELYMVAKGPQVVAQGECARTLVHA
jgi:hypothetical protein